MLLLLPLSLAMDDGEFDHGGGGGGGGGPATAAAVAVAALDNNWCQKRPAMRALTVLSWHAMTKADGGRQCNNQTGFHPSWSTFLRYCVVSKIH